MKAGADDADETRMSDSQQKQMEEFMKRFALIVAVPVLLFLAILLLSPGKPAASEFSRSQPFSRAEYEGGLAAAIR